MSSTCRYLIFIGLAAFLSGCQFFSQETIKVRQPKDTSSYATRGPQMDEVLKTVYRKQDTIRTILQQAGFNSDTRFKVSIVPNDNYANAGYFYPMTLFNLRCKTILIFGQSHHAPEDIGGKLIFGSFSHWQGPYDSIKVSPLRDHLKHELPSRYYTTNDSLMKTETTIEALLPYIQHIDRDVKIVPILVAPEQFDYIYKLRNRMGEIIHQYLENQEKQWGQDFGIAISSNAVEYDSLTYKNFKSFKDFKNDTDYINDTVAYRSITKADKDLANYMANNFDQNGVTKLSGAIQDTIEYQDWEGMYAVIFGLWTSYKLQENADIQLEGYFLNYSTSAELDPLSLEQYHLTARQDDFSRWTGYVGLVYK